MTLAPTSVVVIESHPLMRAALCAAIADEPDLTIAAISADGHDILAMADALHPDVILFALDAAGAEDLEALKSLREKLPSVSILALMSEESTGMEQAALESGARAILSKAAPRNEILSALRKLHTPRPHTVSVVSNHG
jgi:DNA-binding NarL/FixJ family response regulator